MGEKEFDKWHISISFDKSSMPCYNKSHRKEKGRKIMVNEFEVVRLADGTYTYRNVATGELFTQRFAYAHAISEGFGVVLDENGFTYFNPYTKQICKQHFKQAFDVFHGVASVDDEAGRTFFVPKSEHLFNARFSPYSGDCNMENALRFHPEDFEFLPTIWFRDESQIRKNLNAMAEGLRKKCSSAEYSVEKVKQYTESVKSSILNKIQKEKKTIQIEDEKNGLQTKPLEKDVIIKNAAADIKNIERII